MTETTGKPSWPWYAFHYRYLGPSGTFWLWVACLLGLWIYGGDGYIALLNRHPVSRRVANAASGQEIGRYWVQLQGLEIKDARKLIGQLGQSGAPVRLFLDDSDPAAERWRQLSNIAYELTQNADEGNLSSGPKLREFERLMSQFQRDRDKYLPIQSLRLFEHGDIAVVTSDCNVGQPSGRLSQRAKSPEELVLDAKRDLIRAVKLISQNVDPSVEIEGILDSTPKSLRKRLYSELGLDLSTQTLRVKRRPYFLPLWIVLFCLFNLVFLLAGLLTSMQPGAQLPSSASQPKPDQGAA